MKNSDNQNITSKDSLTDLYLLSREKNDWLGSTNIASEQLDNGLLNKIKNNNQVSFVAKPVASGDNNIENIIKNSMQKSEDGKGFNVYVPLISENGTSYSKFEISDKNAEGKRDISYQNYNPQNNKDEVNFNLTLPEINSVNKKALAENPPEITSMSKNTSDQIVSNMIISDIENNKAFDWTKLGLGKEVSGEKLSKEDLSKINDFYKNELSKAVSNQHISPDNDKYNSFLDNLTQENTKSMPEISKIQDKDNNKSNNNNIFISDNETKPATQKAEGKNNNIFIEDEKPNHSVAKAPTKNPVPEEKKERLRDNLDKLPEMNETIMKQLYDSLDDAEKKSLAENYKINNAQEFANRLTAQAEGALKSSTSAGMNYKPTVVAVSDDLATVNQVAGVGKMATMAIFGKGIIMTTPVGQFLVGCLALSIITQKMFLERDPKGMGMNAMYFRNEMKASEGKTNKIVQDLANKLYLNDTNKMFAKKMLAEIEEKRPNAMKIFAKDVLAEIETERPSDMTKEQSAMANKLLDDAHNKDANIKDEQVMVSDVKSSNAIKRAALPNSITNNNGRGM